MRLQAELTYRRFGLRRSRGSTPDPPWQDRRLTSRDPTSSERGIKHDVLAWGPVAAWILVLFLLSRLTSIPGPLEPFTVLGDKIIHFLLYTVLGAGLAHARGRGRWKPRHFVMVLLGSLYGALDEVHQYFVPGRVAEVGDWVANTLGVLAGYAALTLLLHSSRTRRIRETSHE